MSNSSDMVEVPELDYDVADWQSVRQYRVPLMAKIVACCSILVNFLTLLDELKGTQTWQFPDCNLLWMEALASMLGYVGRWIRPMFENLTAANLRTNTKMVEYKAVIKSIAMDLGRLEELLILFQDLANRTFERILRGNPSGHDLERFFTNTANIHEQHTASRRSAAEIVLHTLVLFWYQGKRLINNDPGDDNSWMDFASKIRHSRQRYYGQSSDINKRLYATDAYLGLPRTLAVSFTPDGVVTGGTMVEWGRLDLIKVRGMNKNARQWYKDVRQGRFTPKEQDFITGRIIRHRMVYDRHMQAGPALVGDNNPAQESLLRMYHEEVARRSTDPFELSIVKFPVCAFEGSTLEIKPPCTMCQTAYPMKYPASTTLDNPSASEVTQTSHEGACAEAPCFVGCMKSHPHRYL
ncbi:MAG: hypothetical protein LQ337_004563 [Flavoplaca oasis]|nr:MAG: hypothetical protein LQ337_004563 [Flavoplaca oasis]